jgi:hypothetical protein
VLAVIKAIKRFRRRKGEKRKEKGIERNRKRGIERERK